MGNGDLAVLRLHWHLTYKQEKVSWYSSMTDKYCIMKEWSNYSEISINQLSR